MLKETVRTTITSLFQVKYNLQSLCPQLAGAIRGRHKREKGNSIETGRQIVVNTGSTQCYDFENFTLISEILI